MLNLKNRRTLDAQDDNDNSSSWCTLSIDEAKLRAKVQHIERGKFKILADENGDKYTNNIVDASDIFHCR
jgi:hypothetical protein